MIIYDKDGNVVLDIEVDDTSVAYEAIKGDSTLTLKYSLAVHKEIPLGAYCTFEGKTYSLMAPQDITMHSRRNFEYSLVMYSDDAKAKVYMFVNPIDGRVKFPLTATPREHLQMFVDNMNMRDSGWSIGSCEDGPQVVLSYNLIKCYDALSQLAEETQLDFWFTGKQVHLGRLELNKDNPLPLSYGGDGQGLKQGTKRVNYSGAMPVELLYVQGGSKNIDRSRYGADELHLPKSRTLGYDGVHFSDEPGYMEANGRKYQTDANGYYITRADKEAATHSEDSLDCTHIEATAEVTVLDVATIDKEKHFYDILISSTFDYNDYVIAGEKVTIIFQTGMLTGKEFDLATDENGNLVRRHPDGFPDNYWLYEIAPQDIDGITMPDEASGFMVKRNDIFKVFGIQLPDEYIADNTKRSGAEWDMFRYAIKYFYANEDQQFTISCELDEIYAKRNWSSIKDRIALGSYISFYDRSFQEDPLLIRIVGIKRYINNPHSPVLEISNASVGGTLVGALKRIESQEVYNEQLHQQSISYTKRRWRDTQETISMLQQAMLEGFTDSLSPITLQTMSVLVGSESLQFRFVNNMTDPSSVAPSMVYDKLTGKLVSYGDIIQHMTIGIDSMSNSHDASEYKYWSVTAGESEPTDPNKAYYLYIRASRSTQAAAFVLSETAISMEQESGFYHFLTAILNKEADGDRSIVTLYGFTEILPGQITTDIIKDTDGHLVIDLAKATITAKDGARILGDITFGSATDGLGNLGEWQSFKKDYDDTIEQLNKDAEQTTEELNQAIADAEEAAKNYTDEGKAALQKSIDELNESKAGINEVYTKSAADGLINSAEQRANEKAQEVADAAQRLAELNSNAYADGVADDAELAAIADAEAKLATAKGELNASIEEVRGIASTADAATKTLDTKITNVETGITESIGEINARLDGVVENYFKDGVPLTTNSPVSEWKAESEEDDYALLNHIGDTYTNINEYHDSAGNVYDTEAGKSWRWCECWDSIAESQIILTCSNLRVDKRIVIGNLPLTNYSRVLVYYDDELIEEKAYTEGIGWYTPSGIYINTSHGGELGKVSVWDDPGTNSAVNLKLVFYYNDFTTVVDKDGNTRYLHWHPIADSDAVKALLEASKAKTAADGKARNFVTQPKPPYSVGDTWMQGSSGDIMRCKVARETGSYTASDWEIAAKYTDDTKANEAMAKASSASTLAQNASDEAATATETSNAASAVSEAAKNLANEAKSNASEAITKSNTAQDIANDAKHIADSAQDLADSAKSLAQTANTNADKAVKDASDAKTEASTATTKLSDWSSDSVISPFEKQGVKDELAFVVADKNDIDKQVTKYELTTNAAYTTFGSKFTAYKNDLTTITNATTESVSIPSGMTTHQSEYYTARTTLLEAIATAAKKVATDAQTAADTAQTAADNAKTAADNAQEAADKAQTAADAAQTKADSAYSVAGAARTRLINWASDSYISPPEKRGIKDEKTFVLSDAEEIIQDAAKYSVDATSFTSATTAYVNELDRIINATAENVPVQNLVTIQGNYYNERTAILEAIATEAKGAIDAAFSEASRAVINANEAKTKAENAVKDAQAAKDTLTEWASDGVISPVEKQALKTELNKVLGEHGEIQHQKNIYDSQALVDSWRDYADAWDVYVSELEYIILEEGSVEIGDLASLQSSYYDARTTVLSDIADAAKALADSKVSPDDVQYLKDTFGQVTSGQVFLGKLMGVGTGVDASINAYMDGSGLVSNTSDGKLMIATGIPTGSGTLATRAASASTRIYEKGKIVSKDVELEGKITATSGKIGVLQVNTDGSVTVDNPTTSGAMELSESGIYIHGGSGRGSIHIGDCPGAVFQAFGVGGNPVCVSEEFHVGVFSTSDKAAFFCNKGMFYGLRPCTRKVTTSLTLEDSDHTIIVNTSSSITITLPYTPMEGQTYRICKKYASGNLTIHGNTKNIRNLFTGNYLTEAGKETTSASKWHLTTNANMIDLVYDGTEWLAAWAH